MRYKWLSIEKAVDITFVVATCFFVLKVPGKFLPYGPLALLSAYFGDMYRESIGDIEEMEVGTKVLRYSAFSALLYLLSLL